MPKTKKETPEFFEEISFDPVLTATGRIERKPVSKKKVGFYISADLLERFNRKFHELKLSGVAIENKSALLAAALSFALNDIDSGEKSYILKRLQ